MSALATSFAALGRRMRLAAVARGAAAWCALAGGLVLAACWLDAALRLPAAVRLAALVAIAAVAGRLAWLWIALPARRRLSAAAAALAAERLAGRSDNRWINAVQLDPDGLPEGMRAFAAANAKQAEGLTIPAAALIGVRALAWSLAAAAVALALWAGSAALAPHRFATALHRFAAPLADVPPAGAVSLRLQPDRDCAVPLGGDLPLLVTVETAGAPPPSLLWAEGAARAPEDPADPAAERLALEPDGPGRWKGRLAALHRGGALRAVCGDGATPSLRVAVIPPPRLAASAWVVTAPALYGEPPRTLPGPPAPCTAIAGSTVELRLTLDPPVAGLRWTVAGKPVEAAADGRGWRAATALAAASDWIASAATPAGTVEVARGRLELELDRPPEAALDAGGPAVTAVPGQKLQLAIAASDDHGLARVELRARDSSGGDPAVAKAWDLAGPPGPKEQKLPCELPLDPARFPPGRAWILLAVAIDRAGQEGASQPVVLRVLSPDQIAAGDPADRDAVAALKEAIARQRDALGLCDNLQAQLADVLAGKRLARSRDAVAARQDQAATAAKRARDAFAKSGDAALGILVPLVDGEMPAAAKALAALDRAPDPAKAVAAIHERQQYILDRLLAALGAAAQPAAKPAVAAGPADAAQGPDATAEARRLAADLAGVVKAQERILERSRNLLGENPADLSDDKDKVLGALAREQGELAAFMQEKLSDFSKLPPQDASDMSLVKEGNVVFQEMSQAAAALYQKHVELAVPAEQGGLELAKKIENNLERWLSDKPDNTQWKMEDLDKPADVPLAELPRELEDIVGDLLDDANKMDPGNEDVTSNQMDSLDKGAGWGTGDGPISNMSARGITGNVLPNNNEVGGRSGEGRSGRSSGQMVGNEAEGKGGRETPTRLSPGAFEQGSVKDKMEGSAGGATGGGKVSGSDAEGLHGPVPPALREAMQRLAGNHAQLAQQSGELALRLRTRHVPNPSLETASKAFSDAAEAARRGDLTALRQRHDAGVDALTEARREVATSGLSRERIDLDRKDPGVTQGAGDRVPPGYEQMAERYFRALAEDK